MRELVVLSGKGGTGKTSIVGSLAALAENKVMADCDVDAADLHLLLNPSVKQTEEFWSGQTAFIDSEKCTKCGLCVKLCRFDAIKNYKVDPIACEGCGFCSHICPVEAIKMQDNMAGYLFISDTKYGPLVHAKLGIAQENSGKLVAKVRQEAKKLAAESGAEYIICDGPPGIGCPVVSSLSGANMALLVIEPTLSGIHDMERVIGVCHHFNIPALVCINKYDINEENSREIERYCKTQNVEVVAKIPFDNVVTEAMVKGIPVVEYSESAVSKEIKSLWQNVLKSLSSK
ncbi:MAG TPA: (4Fe-4S)-binding protein [Dehalococcoidia bacterium]|nr:(4Fe-4S)-binding protein [Dehalococcoidia bacterium]HAS27739.1 (4Fe-4S)-binding protein [Dehalococcoidia bacterium]